MRLRGYEIRADPPVTSPNTKQCLGSLEEVSLWWELLETIDKIYVLNVHSRITWESQIFWKKSAELLISLCSDIVRKCLEH